MEQVLNQKGREKDRIEEFIKIQGKERGLDERTVKAYRLDLEHLHQWFRENGFTDLDGGTIERYLKYLINERKLRTSTITRKYRVFCYYTEYLFRQGISSSCPLIEPPSLEVEGEKRDNVLSKAEIDSFFIALSREYEDLDNDFRKRICLRDNVMMELLFYHGLEVSELLRLHVSDYDKKTGILVIRGKRKGQREIRLFSRNLRKKMELWLDIHTYFETQDQYQTYLFLSKMGRPLSMKMVICIFDKYRIMAGIEKESTPKDLKCSMKRYAQELMVERCS